VTAGDIGGIVLAGGAGRRFGQPKAGVVLGGRTLVERAIDALRPHCGAVLVVSRPEVALPPLDVPVRFDRPGPDAPLTGLATGLAAIDAADVLVLACDLPLAAPVVARLAALAPGTVAAGRARDTGRWQPLCARYARLPALQACEGLLAGGEARLHRLVEGLRPIAIECGPLELANVNAPGDLDRLSGLRPRPAAC
jgi:molybdopterin-guanine dinucleotide biosynthesis protein A